MKPSKAAQPRKESLHNSAKTNSEPRLNKNILSEAPSNKTKQDSKTGVYNVFGGRRVVMSFRCSEELKKAFIPVAKHYFGSVCRPLEAFMASILTAVNEHVNFGNTVVIEKLEIKRALRPRRYARGSRDYAEVDVVIEDVGSLEKCFECGERPGFVGFRNERERSLRVFCCERHFKRMDFDGWRRL
jgi:hypothetical protein